MSQPSNPESQEYIEVFGARENNLKNIDVRIPRNKLVVITGVSGSGKSSIAFDTLYAEGQRRYMESFSAYARSFMGDMQRPDVDKVEGLSPVISIEQKTTSKNPRSTVGTTTEIYDFLRLLYARTAEAYSYISGKKMERQSEDQILHHILHQQLHKKVVLLAPIVKGRKGHYREEFQKIRKMGFTKARVDGEIIELEAKTEVDRYKIHDIEIVVDRIIPSPEDTFRISQSLRTAMNLGKGIVMTLDEQNQLQYYSKYLMDAENGLSYDEPAPNSFSYNSPYGWCPTCEGLGVVQNITEDTIMPDKNLSITRGGLAPLGEYRDTWIFTVLEAILKSRKQSMTTPLKDLPKEVIDILLYGSEERFKVSNSRYKDEWNTKFEGILHYLKRQQSEGSEKIQDWLKEFAHDEECPDCKGARLKKESLHFKLNDKNISELTKMDLQSLYLWIDQLEPHLTEKQRIIAHEVIKEIKKRLRFMLDVGLDYLTLDRTLRTLSGGESQRIRLATQIGTQLTGVLYILDEPSIGLHQRDNQKLIQSLKELRDLGNTVLVVEHDKDMMLHSDYILEIGPGAGIHGGRVVAQGSPHEFLQIDSSTARYISGRVPIKLEKKDTLDTSNHLVLTGARGNNLKNVDLKIPLGKMVCITGVSGSGKSTLIHETLYPILSKHFYHSKAYPLPYQNIAGLEHLDKVIEIDQSPIGRTPRSNPATYTGVFSDIRNLFAQLPESKIRGYSAGRFSFNVKGGRCEVCEGAGVKTIAMDFLPEVQVICENCKGKRYNRETLDVRFKGKSISDVLEMTVESAVQFFDNQPKIQRYMQILYDVGLGYLTIGQHATTLSGGEAQRVKLATELAKKDTGKTFYILDEPTTGLHFQDIHLLLKVLQKLVDKGNTVLIVEHNMDVIKCADWIIDLGPESGHKGGKIVCEGTPTQVAASSKGYTAKFLKDELFDRKN